MLTLYHTFIFLVMKNKPISWFVCFFIWGRVTNKLLATEQYKKPRTLNTYELVILAQATNKNNMLIFT